MTKKELTPEVRANIIDLFLAGQSVNHIVYLLDYEYVIDQVTEVLQTELRRKNEALKAAKDELENLKQYLYNPFERDNQSSAYKRLVSTLAALEAGSLLPLGQCGKEETAKEQTRNH